MPLLVHTSAIRFTGETSSRALGLILTAGDVARCQSCMVPVEVKDTEMPVLGPLTVVRCGMCHRWRAAHHVEGRDDNADRSIA